MHHRQSWDLVQKKQERKVGRPCARVPLRDRGTLTRHGDRDVVTRTKADRTVALWVEGPTREDFRLHDGTERDVKAGVGTPMPISTRMK